MKLEKLSDDNLIVFLNSFCVEKYKFSIKDNLEDSFRKFLKRLNNYYNIETNGYYDIKIYQDNIYGFILDIKKEDIDFYGYYDDHIDIKISILKDNKFVFKIDDYSLVNKGVLKYCYLLKQNKSLYFVPKQTINQYHLGYVVENCKIIYGTDANEILNKGEYINTSKVFV